MKRYDLVQVNACYTTDHQMEPNDDGEWVRYEIAEALLDEIDTLCQAIEGHRGGALTNDGLWHYHEKARALLQLPEGK